MIYVRIYNRERTNKRPKCPVPVKNNVHVLYIKEGTHTYHY